MNNQLNIIGLKQGLTIGLINAGICFMLYYIDKFLFIGLAGMTTFIATSWLLIRWGRKQRDIISPNGLSYGAAIIYSTIVIFTADLITETTSITIWKNDKALQEYMIQTQEEGSKLVFELMDIKGIEAEKNMDEIKNDLTNRFYYSSLMDNGRMLLFRAIFLSFIISYFLKKQATQSDE